jgi:hypothetical protein
MTVSASQILRALRHTWKMANPWRPMIRDARGRAFPVYRLDRRWFQIDRNTELPREQFDRLRSHLLRQTTHGMGARPFVMWMLVIGYTAFFAWMILVTSVPRLSIAAFAIIIGVFIWSALTYNRRVPKAGRVLIAAGLIREGRCASCAYDLRSTPRDADGLAPCPECGAAWPAPPARAAVPASCSCGYDLLALPAINALVTCPECGRSYPA